MNPLSSPLLTDLYQLTMIQAYVEKGLNARASFEFFARSLPEQRSFLVACGLESCIQFLECMRFTDSELDYLSRSGRFSPATIRYLGDLRFSGDVYAMPEGSICFADEPLIRIEAPIGEAQLVETRLINLIQYQTLVASKAARCVLAADGRATLIDFGLRRAHGAEAGLLAARASYIAGFIGTSTVLADALFGIPIFGTMAHSFIQAHDSEQDAFIDFCLANPNNTTLLIDTYDTLAGARTVVEVSRTLASQGIRVQRVRLDSGDFLALSREVRQILDRGGCQDIQIFVSGNMDEFSIRDLLDAGAPVDGFGVGTKLITSADAPYLECAYKLTEYAGRARMKTSTGKVSLPGRKQIFRAHHEGRMAGDTITLMDDPHGAHPLLVPVMIGGKRLAPPRTLADIARATQDQLAALPVELRRLEPPSAPYPVRVSAALESLRQATAHALAGVS